MRQQEQEVERRAARIPQAVESARQLLALRAVHGEDIATSAHRRQDLIPFLESAAVRAGIARESLILIGPPNEQETLAAVITELDRRRPQVMIEALVVEVSGTRNLDIGTELAYLRPLRKGDSGAGGVTSFGLSAIDLATGTSAIASLPGLTGFILRDADVQAIVHLFEQKIQGKVVSRPRTLVNDNESALFRSEQEQPYTQISSLSATTTVSFQDYARAGISLSITPHISEADYLQIEITVNLSAFSGDAPSPSTPPPRTTNFVQSKVTVPDNSTVLLGGLNQANRAQTARQVPILGDIPILGYLFRRNTANKSASTLYVFVKSRIARAEDFSDLKSMGAEASRDLLRQENLQRPAHDQIPVDQDVYQTPALRPEGIHEP